MMKIELAKQNIIISMTLRLAKTIIITVQLAKTLFKIINMTLTLLVNKIQISIMIMKWLVNKI